MLSLLRSARSTIFHFRLSVNHRYERYVQADEDRQIHRDSES